MDLHNKGYHLIMHFAPTCSTMTRARQRCELTRVRDAEHPWGIPGLKGKNLRDVNAANDLAVATDYLAGKAHSMLNADISVENPEPSLSGCSACLNGWESWIPCFHLACWATQYLSQRE